MEQKRSCEVKRLMLLVLLLLACMVLVVGATWARYSAKSENQMLYSAREVENVSIWASYDEEEGTLTGTPGWTLSSTTGLLSFCVSNGTSGTDYAAEDLAVSIRLISSLSITGADVSLTMGDKLWDATPIQIQEGTPLYKTFDGGYVYLFLDDSGEELSWTLKGETLSVLQALLQVANLEQDGDAALLQLQIVGK